MYAWSDSKTFAMWFDEVFLPFARYHTRGTVDKVLVLRDPCCPHDSLRNPERRIQVFMSPLNSTAKRQPIHMGIIAATELHYRPTLLLRRSVGPAKVAQACRRKQS